MEKQNQQYQLLKERLKDHTDVIPPELLESTTGEESDVNLTDDSRYLESLHHQQILLQEKVNQKLNLLKQHVEGDSHMEDFTLNER